MGTYVRAAAQDSERLAADRAWVGWGVAAAATGMLAWVIGFALIPLDAKLDNGDQHLVQVLRAHMSQLYAARCWRCWARCCWRRSSPCSPAWSPKAPPAGVCCACPWPGA